MADWDGRKAGVPLPVGFHNWPVEHKLDGTHGDVTADTVEADSIDTDAIDEKTPDAGVTIETVPIKDGEVDGVDVSAHAADADAHHNEAHQLDPTGGPHTGALPEGDVTFDGAGHAHGGGADGQAVAHGDTSGQTTDDHHNEAHDIDPGAGPHTGGLPETSVEFDNAAGHDHDGATSKAVAHSDTTGQGTDDHHAQAHAASHSKDGADEVTVENLLTAGAAGLVPVSQGDTSLAMAAPTPAAHDLAGALHNAATLAELNLKVSDTDLIGADGSVPMTGDFDINCNRIIKPKSLGGLLGKAVVYLGPAGCCAGLQAAIDDLGGPGVVYVLPGYTETPAATIVPVSNLTVLCPSRDAVITDDTGRTMIQYAGFSDVTFDGVEFVGPGSGSANIVFGHNAGTGNPSHWRIRNCTFTDVSIILRTFTAYGYVVTDWRFENIHSSGFSYRMFYMTAYGASRVFVDGWTHRGDGTGIMAYWLDTNHYMFPHFRNLHIYNVAEMSYHRREGNWNWQPMEWENCVLHLATRGWGRAYAGTTSTVPVKYINCTAYLVQYEGFDIDLPSELENCRSIDCGTGDAGNRDGISIGANADRTRLINTSSYNYGTANQRYGVRIDSGATKCEVRGGRFDNNATGPILNNEPSTILDYRDD